MNRLSTVMEVASLNPVTMPHFIIFFFRYYIFINLSIHRYNCLNIIHNHFQTIWVAVYRFNGSNNTYPIELTHSVASRICVFVFNNVPFDGHFV